ncbi:MAG TPA: hypothetical protein VF340_00205, partial [Methyloceanibacter sp.]
MAKVQFLNRLRLAPAPAPRPLPALAPIAPVQNADQRRLSFPRGPAPGSRLGVDFVREIGRFAYLWAWPMVNVYTRYTSLRRIWRPIEDEVSNWLPAPRGEFSLYIRAYWPLTPIAEGSWTPP